MSLHLNNTKSHPKFKNLWSLPNFLTCAKLLKLTCHLKTIDDNLSTAKNVQKATNQTGITNVLSSTGTTTAFLRHLSFIF